MKIAVEKKLASQWKQMDAGCAKRIAALLDPRAAAASLLSAEQACSTC